MTRHVPITPEEHEEAVNYLAVPCHGCIGWEEALKDPGSDGRLYLFYDGKYDDDLRSRAHLHRLDPRTDVWWGRWCVAQNITPKPEELVIVSTADPDAWFVSWDPERQIIREIRVTEQGDVRITDVDGSVVAGSSVHLVYPWRGVLVWLRHHMKVSGMFTKYVTHRNDVEQLRSAQTEATNLRKAADTLWRIQEELRSARDTGHAAEATLQLVQGLVRDFMNSASPALLYQLEVSWRRRLAEAIQLGLNVDRESPPPDSPAPSA